MRRAESGSESSRGAGLRKLVVFAGVAALIFVGALVYPTYREATFRLGLYNESPMGRDFSPFVEEADGVVECGDMKVLYFFGHGPFSKKAQLPRRVKALADLPVVYDAMQFMLDADGHLVARGWCGETTSVVTVQGTFKGSALSELPGLELPFQKNSGTPG